MFSSISHSDINSPFMRFRVAKRKWGLDRLNKRNQKNMILWTTFAQIYTAWHLRWARLTSLRYVGFWLIIKIGLGRGTEAQLVLLISFKCMGKGNNKNHQQCIPADAVIHAAELHVMNQNIQKKLKFWEAKKLFEIRDRYSDGWVECTSYDSIYITVFKSLRYQFETCN